ncbi:Uncharacterised protein [Vibrio cholerae]|nr:Uncharacterised protein [Vibrio cholerae]
MDGAMRKSFIPTSLGIECKLNTMWPPFYLSW